MENHKDKNNERLRGGMRPASRSDPHRVFSQIERTK